MRENTNTTIKAAMIAIMLSATLLTGCSKDAKITASYSKYHMDLYNTLVKDKTEVLAHLDENCKGTCDVDLDMIKKIIADKVDDEEQLDRLNKHVEQIKSRHICKLLS